MGLIVDNFAGGGGASKGIEQAMGRHIDIAINHDPDAIKMHKVNHPHTKHYCENIWDVNPKEACGNNPVDLAWFSPDCKHFSKAKGSKPVDKNIRGLAWVVLRWAAAVRPALIILENVEEFTTWCPIKKGKPIKKRYGETFNKFINQLKSLGYEVEYKVLKACDYGAPTKRKRFFMIARCDGKPIVFPKPTHAAKDSEKVLKNELQPYVPASTIFNWDIPILSIFERKKPLTEPTLKRIARGIKKFIIEENKPFIVPIGYGEAKGQLPRVHNVDEPLPTIVASNKHYLVTAFITKYYGGGYTGSGSSLEEPISTITTIDHNALCQVVLSDNTNHNRKEEVNAFLVSYYSTGKPYSLDEPIGTITTKDRFGLVTINRVDYQIVDIGLRMLSARELYRGQGFPDDYIIDVDSDGKYYPIAKQIARCGNAVPPAFSKALVKANYI